MARKLLSVRNLKTSFFTHVGEVKAVRGISFDVNEGEVLGIVGESGSGKSVTSLSIMGLLQYPGRVVDGEILLNGEDILTYSKNQMRRVRGKEIAMIFQDPMASLNERAKVDYIVSEGLQNVRKDLSKEERSKMVEQALLDVGLLPEFASRFPHEFSGGQRQRIGIARALIMEPEFIIADEPISALDVSIRAQVLNLMSKLQKEHGLTYLFIAHDLSVMRFICDRIAVIHKGVIVELAETEKLFAHPLHPYTRALLSAIPLPDPKSEKHKKLVIYDPSCHHYETDKPVWTEIEPGHFIMANKEELEKYNKMLGK